MGRSEILKRLHNWIAPISLTADGDGGNVMDLNTQSDLAKKPGIKLKTDEVGRGISGDLDDINANKHHPARKMGT
jgi:hypothetical protein